METNKSQHEPYNNEGRMQRLVANFNVTLHLDLEQCCQQLDCVIKIARSGTVGSKVRSCKSLRWTDFSFVMKSRLQELREYHPMFNS